MKRIEVVIRPFELRDVRARLAALGVGGLTVGEVMGVGPNGDAEVRGTPTVQLLLVVSDACVTDAVEAIRNGARVGGVTEGRIVVTSVMEAVRVRTGERGQSAI